MTTVSMIKTSYSNEAAAVDRLTAPSSDSDRSAAAWRDDTVVAMARRGSRDAVFASCARRGTWDHTLARIAVSDAVDDDRMTLLARQNVAMFTVACAWRAGMLDFGIRLIEEAPAWQEHRGLELVHRMLSRGFPFDQWEAAMRTITVQTCLAFEN
jgi:alpha-D-ribose 1-methylphosphonate 5-triphosphate synthase subunit PhnI